MRYLKTILFLLLTPIAVSAQITDLARLEYTYFPQRQSDNSFKRFRALVQIPLKINENGAYLVPGFEYRNVNFDYEDTTNFPIDKLDNFDSYKMTLGYTFKLKEDLRFAANSGVLIASNFENGNVTSDDILYSGSVFLVKDRTGEGEAKKPWRLIMGLQYSTRAGIPFPLPVLNYYKRFHPKWNYGLGVPKSNIKYHFNKKNKLQAFVTLDGFYANIQNNVIINNNNVDNISMTIVLGGIGYENHLTKHLVFFTYIGSTLLNDIRLRDKKENDVLTINDVNSFYIRGGLKFKI